jgi:TIR domain
MQTIFVSYRREDTPHAAERIFDHLSGKYKNSVFRDIDSIKPGVPVRNAIGAALRQCAVVVAIVGPNWLGKNADGSLRINAPHDWVRNEIEMALQLGIPIIPVTVDLDSEHEGRMPSSQDVPESLRDFANLNGVKAETGRAFKEAMEKVTGAIDAAWRGGRTFKPGGLPPLALIGIGVGALIIGWLMLDEDSFDNMMSAFGPILAIAGFIAALAGIVLLIRSRSRSRR